MGVISSTIKPSFKRLIYTISSIFDLARFKNQPKFYGKMVYRILVGSYTDAVYTLEFDPSKPPDSALRHPTDPTLVFTALEQSDGCLIALRYNSKEGELKVVATVPSRGKYPCTILATENEVLVGNYLSGTVGKPVELKEGQAPFQFSGTGPCTERQEASHPHQVYLATHALKDGRGPSAEILVPDLGADKIWRLTKGTDGKWEQKGEVVFDKHPGGGPRHVIVHDAKLYTLLELTSEVTVHDFPPPSDLGSTTSPSLLASTTLSMPTDIPPLTMLASELLLPQPNATFPSPLLYAANRNDPRAHGDNISVFILESRKQSLELVGEVHTGLTHLRAFAFFGPDSRYLVAGGANGGGVKVFERIDDGKRMREVAHLLARDGGAGLAPTSFLCF
ncbi:putative isomerase YbhE [Phellopilus nigrolimitatus]|nr:putative isomerase YbhE [Phellopilus nigrolimitatus]